MPFRQPLLLTNNFKLQKLQMCVAFLSRDSFFKVRFYHIQKQRHGDGHRDRERSRGRSHRRKRRRSRSASGHSSDSADSRSRSSSRRGRRRKRSVERDQVKVIKTLWSQIQLQQALMSQSGLCSVGGDGQGNVAAAAVPAAVYPSNRGGVY